MGWTVVPVCLLILWEIIAWAWGSPWLFPRFTVVFIRLVHPFEDLLSSGSLAVNSAVSLVRVLIGFALAACLGIPLGVLLGAVRVLRNLVEPTLEILRPLCPVAWMPFAIAVFKLETLPQMVGVRHSGTLLDHVQLGMVFVLFWGAFFPVIINTIDGVRGVRRQYIALAHTLGANSFQTFVHVYVPASLPMILTGLRQGIGTCWFVIIAAEMLPGSDSGIGYLLLYAADQCAMDIVIACMIIIGGTGALLNGVVRGAGRFFVKWHGKEQ